MEGSQSTLDGIRVLDLTQFEAGPACTEVLAWLGAEVVKVENPKGGDPGRSTGAKGGKDGRWFVLLNANKKSITVDLKSPDGVTLLKDMVKKADVFVENFAPGTVERLGLGYDELSKINPKLVYAQIKGFGSGSPYERNLALDTIGQASGGSMSVTGERGGRPLRPGPSVADSGSGMLLTIGIVSALFRALRTGQGAHVEVAMQDAVMQFIRGAFAEHDRTGKAAPRAGTKSAAVINVPSDIYPCRPGGPNDFVYIYPHRNNPQHWRRLLEVIGRTELIGDARYETPEARVKNEAEVDAIITEWTLKHDKREAARLVGEAGIPAGPVFDTMDLESDPTFEQRGIMQRIHHPTHGEFKMLTWPVRCDGVPARIEPAPLLGQHTEEVLLGWLGVQGEQLRDFRARRII